MAQPQQPPDLYVENGRSYHSYQRGLYWLPHDDAECERLDVLHNLFYQQDQLNLPLHSAPLRVRPDDPLRILDLGCGTGFWAIDIADQYESNAEVIGLDLVNAQPPLVPRNASFIVNKSFNERFWPFAEDHFDLIHLSMITACVVEWPQMYDKIFRYLRPSIGYVEHLEFDLTPRYLGGPRINDSNIIRFWEDLVRASADAGRPIAYDPQATFRDLTGAGFVDIDHRVIPVPWQYDPRRDPNYKIGATFDVAFLKGVGLESYAMAPFSRVNQWSAEEIRRYIKAVCDEFHGTRVELESHVHIWRARKP
ncbi:LaeA-like protein [Myriangium duriaei CBS 260.36]|uniref:LaeA-like protein n=1 Tax=Myriangium duriaei CBS 260.36 TaxID=1168546 RepID=A0A9P4IVP7_9PEZI|nr:LaeA-like protein [Myriangium duriaei CBS 260.36]